jgi:hypothetical protein
MNKPELDLLKEDAATLVEYLYNDEQNHFECASKEEQKNHIFLVVSRMAKLLKIVPKNEV